MCPSDKKVRERWALDRLLDHLDLSSPPVITQRETPDFLVEMSEGTVGLEVTRYAPGHAEPGGSHVLRLQGQRAALIEEAHRQHRARGGRDVRVFPYWTFDGPPLKRPRINELATRLAEVVHPVAEELYREPLTRYYRPAELGWEPMAAAGLAQHLSGLSITRFRETTAEERWLTPVSGMVGLPVDELEHIVQGKEGDLPRWPKVDERALLVVLWIESLAEITQSVRDLVLSTAFDEVFVLEEIHYDLARLTVQKSP